MLKSKTLRLRFIVEKANGRLICGICWSKETRPPYRWPEVNALSKCLLEDGLGQTQWWIGMRTTDYWLTENSTLVRIANDDDLQEELAGLLIGLFEKYRVLTEEANKALEREKKP